jgi:protein gp37
MVFVNSMSDLFQDAVPSEYVSAVGAVMAASPWHVYQVLTKRATRLRNVLSNELAAVAPKLHIWWGVSVENRKYGLPRIDLLRQAPAGIRFLSIEPLLEDLGEINLEGIHWVIVGGESGPGARPMHREWVESIRKQCERDNVAFFFKQWGGVRKSKTGRTLNERTYDAFPTVIRAQVPDRQTRERLAGTLRHSLSGIDRVSPLHVKPSPKAQIEA